MAITVNTTTARGGASRDTDGASTTGNETVFKLDPKRQYSIQATNVSAGVASLKTMVKQVAPNTITDLTGFSASESDTGLSDTFSRVIWGGAMYAVIEVDSGSWEVSITEHHPS